MSNVQSMRKMTKQDLDKYFSMLRDVQDVISLAMYEIGIFDEIISNDTQNLCSLSSEAEEIQRVYAYSLIKHRGRINLCADKIFLNKEAVEKALKHLEIITHDLEKGVISLEFEALYKEENGEVLDDGNKRN